MGSPTKRRWVTRLTPPGSGGVAVLEVVGGAAVARLRHLFSGTLPEDGRIAYGVLRDPHAADSDGVPGEILDEVLVVRGVCVPAADPSYELHVHGSPFVVAEIMGRLDPGATGGGAAGLEAGPSAGAAQQATFMERARTLVHAAPSVLGARILMDQAAGAMGRALVSIRAMGVGERGAALQQLASRGRARLPLFDGSTVALVGPVNAGKSTLFNVLVGTDAASVSSEAGTTRDALHERARLGPWPVRFLDTAGERDLAGLVAGGDRKAEVEQAGQRIALELADRADLVLRLTPIGGTPRPVVESPREVVLTTQAATVWGADPDGWPAGALSAQEAPEHARAVVLEAFEAALGLHGEKPLWVPGQAVPFDLRSLGMLEDVAKLQEVDDRALDALSEQL